MERTENDLADHLRERAERAERERDEARRELAKLRARLSLVDDTVAVFSGLAEVEATRAELAEQTGGTSARDFRTTSSVWAAAARLLSISVGKVTT